MDQALNLFFDFSIIEASRKIQVLSFEAFCQYICTVFCRWIAGNQEFSCSKLLVFFPCPASRQLF